jgi:hypothetical protein
MGSLARCGCVGPLFAESAPSRWRLWTNRYTPTAPAVAWLVLLPIRRQAPSRNLGLNFSQLIPLRRIQIIVLSQVEPKLGRVAEVLRQAKSRIGCNRTFPLYDRQNPIRGHMNWRLSALADKPKGPINSCCRISPGVTRGIRLRVIVDDLDAICIHPST